MEVRALESHACFPHEGNQFGRIFHKGLRGNLVQHRLSDLWGVFVQCSRVHNRRIRLFFGEKLFRNGQLLKTLGQGGDFFVQLFRQPADLRRIGRRQRLRRLYG